MGLFHRHNWTEVKRYFVPPVTRKVWNATQQTLYDFGNGYTVVELRCENCGKVGSAHLQGDAT